MSFFVTKLELLNLVLASATMSASNHSPWEWQMPTTRVRTG